MANVNRYLDKEVELQPHQVMKLWRHRPKIFMRDVMDVTLDGWQEDCIDMYMEYQRLAMVASKGPGKTFILSMLGWHFFICYYQPKIAALSISKDHLMSNLWAELLKWRSKSKLLTNSTNDGFSKITLKGHEGYSFIDARAYPKQSDETQQASVLAGLHSDNVGFLIDEAGMIPDAVLATADAALSTGDSDTKRGRLIVTGNPEYPKGMVYRAYMGRSKQRWGIYTISGDPEDPKRAPRVSATWAQEQIDTYGRDNPWVMVNVLAQYPNVTNDFLISEQDVQEAMDRKVTEDDVKNSQMRLGVDVARGGIDSSILFLRKGLLSYPVEEVASDVLGPQLAGKVVLQCHNHTVERIFVDDTGGYGSSVVDSLAQFPHLDVTPIKYNAKAQDSRYFNTRTEMWVRMRDWIKKGGKLPNDPRLAEELMMPKLMFHGGKMRLEDKAQIKTRLGRSPDRADALAQTFVDIEQPSFYAEYSDPQTRQAMSHINKGAYYTDDSHIDKNYNAPSNYKA
jgi:phage terminase large subunit